MSSEPDPRLTLVQLRRELQELAESLTAYVPLPKPDRFERDNHNKIGPEWRIPHPGDLSRSRIVRVIDGEPEVFFEGGVLSLLEGDMEGVPKTGNLGRRGVTWYASGTRPSVGHPGVGKLVAYDYAAWRVISVEPWPEEKWAEQHRKEVLRYGDSVRPVVVVLRPARVTSTDVRARDHDKHFIASGWVSWQVYPDEHYPICATCLEPLPCREKHAARIAGREMSWMARFETPGVCPACGEVVTSRQESRTFQENVEVPAGPPVTFHLRKKCFGEVVRYEEKWVAANPEHRRCVLSCPGMVTHHRDGTYDCTSLDDCPGVGARHRTFQSCMDTDCCSRANQRSWVCHPGPHAVQRNRSDKASADGLF